MLERVNKIRFPNALYALIIFMLGSVVLFWPVLFERRLFSGLYVPFYHIIFFAGQKYLLYGLGVAPNWWPQFFSGYPISITLDGFLNPFFIVALKYATPLVAYNALTIIFFIVNGMSMYACARVCKLSTRASIIAAVTYSFSGIVIRWTDVIVFLSVLPVLPLSFIACVRIYEGATRWVWIWTGILAYGWIGGFSELLVYFLVAVGMFSLYLLIQYKVNNKRSWRSFSTFKPLLLCGISVFSSVVLVAWWFIPVSQFITTASNRAQGVSAAGLASMPTTFSHILHAVLPRLSVYYGESIPYLHLGDDIDLYIGALPILLALVALAHARMRKAKYRMFYIALAVFAFITTLPDSPLFLAMHHLPVLQWFRWQWKWSFLTVFALAMLAGYGLDDIVEFSGKKLIHFMVRCVCVVVGAGVLASVFITVFSARIESKVFNFGAAHFTSAAGSDHVFARSKEYYDSLLHTMAHSLVRGFSLYDPWVVTMIVVWLTACAWFIIVRAHRLPVPYMQNVAVCIVFFGAVAPWINFFKGPPVSYILTPPKTAEYIRSHNAYAILPLTSGSSDVPYRVGLYMPSEGIATLQDTYGVDLVNATNRMWLDRETLDQNLSVMFSIDSVFNHEPLGLGRLQDIYFYLQNIGYESDTARSILGMMNVKYITSAFTLKGGWDSVFTSNAPVVGVPVRVYENKAFMPRWFFAKSVNMVNGPRAHAFDVFKTISDFGTTTMIETGGSGNDAAPIQALLKKDSLQDSISLDLYSAGTFRARTHTAQGRYLVVSESAAPAWRARVDGIPARVFIANYSFLSVYVPAGDHTVEFEYPGLLEQTGQFFSKVL